MWCCLCNTVSRKKKERQRNNTWEGSTASSAYQYAHYTPSPTCSNSGMKDGDMLILAGSSAAIVSGAAVSASADWDDGGSGGGTDSGSILRGGYESGGYKGRGEVSGHSDIGDDGDAVGSQGADYESGGGDGSYYDGGNDSGHGGD